MVKRAREHEELRPYRRRPGRAGRHVGALGALRFAGDHNRTRREHSQIARTARRRETRVEQLAALGLRRTVSAARQTASLLLQTLRTRCAARSQAGRDKEGFAQGDGRSCPRRRAIDGNVSTKMSVKFHAPSVTCCKFLTRDT